jgi:hypothetical protein
MQQLINLVINLLTQPSHISLDPFKSLIHLRLPNIHSSPVKIKLLILLSHANQLIIIVPHAIPKLSGKLLQSQIHIFR